MTYFWNAVIRTAEAMLRAAGGEVGANARNRQRLLHLRHTRRHVALMLPAFALWFWLVAVSAGAFQLQASPCGSTPS